MNRAELKYTAAHLIFMARNRAKRLGNPRRRLLFYGDSRGMNVVSRCGRHPFNPYLLELSARFDLELHLCPEKHTTIVDFLDFIEKTPRQPDAILLHCGVVDFSPRPLSNIQYVFEHKAGRESFTEMKRLDVPPERRAFSTVYKGEPTSTIYSPEYFESNVGPRLARLSGLVWVTSNPFVPGWEGNYSVGRPANIWEVVQAFQSRARKYVRTVLDCEDWVPDQIRERTIDNIHYTARGFEWMGREVHRSIESVLEE